MYEKPRASSISFQSRVSQWLFPRTTPPRLNLGRLEPSNTKRQSSGRLNRCTDRTNRLASSGLLVQECLYETACIHPLQVGHNEQIAVLPFCINLPGIDANTIPPCPMDIVSEALLDHKLAEGDALRGRRELLCDGISARWYETRVEGRVHTCHNP